MHVQKHCQGNVAGKGTEVIWILAVWTKLYVLRHTVVYLQPAVSMRLSLRSVGYIGPTNGCEEASIGLQGSHTPPLPCTETYRMPS